MEHKSNKHSKSKQMVRTKRTRTLPRFIVIGSRQVISEDWSILSGRISHMNDPKMDNQAYNFIDTFTTESLLTTSVTVPILFGIYITLSNFTNASSYAALFDQYRLMQLEIWIIPTGTAASDTTSLYKTVVDYDNATAPSSVAILDTYQNVHTSTLASGQYRRFTPHVAAAVYGGAFTSYGNNVAQWIDCVSTGVQHYGMKLAFDISTAAVPVDVICRASWQFRNRI